MLPSLAQLAFLCLVLLLAGQGSAVAEDDGGPFRIVALGDSITLGARPERGGFPAVAPEETFVEVLRHRLAADGHEVEVHNAGLPGNRTDQGLERLERDVLALEPDAVLIMYGTNDSCHDTGAAGPRLPLEQYEENLQALVSRVRSAGAVPILMTPPALGTGWSVDRHPVYAEEGRNAPLTIYSEAVRRVAAAEGVPLVDHFRKWKEMEAERRDSFLPDGCHPNGSGHDVLTESILPVLRTLVPGGFRGAGGIGRLELSRVSGPEEGGAVLAPAGGGSFDATKVAMPSVLLVDEEYRMWYSSGFTSGDGPGGIGLAASPDGRNWRRLNDGNPVLMPGPEGAFDALQVMGADVHFDGSRYRTWYTGQSAKRHEESGIVHYAIGHADSRDGITWERRHDGLPVVENGPAGSRDSVQAATPSVIRSGDGWRMWYAAWSPEHNHTICTARSVDGIAWEKEGQVHGLSPAVAYGHAVRRSGEHHLMLYMALHATRGLYGAMSHDGRDWSMLNGSLPLLEPAGAGFDAAIVGHPFLHVDGDEVRVWYTGYESRPGGFANWRLAIGLTRGELRWE